MSSISDIRYAQALDREDPLKAYKDKFFIPDSDLIYLDGNSLGRPPLEALSLGEELVGKQWGNRLIRSWNEGWLELPKRIGDKIARLLGASPGEVILADSTSVNLHKLIVSALHLQGDRKTILTDDLNFPSDLYILQGILSLLGHTHQLEIVPSSDGIHGPEIALLDKLTKDTALVTLSHTVFKSGYVYDMEKITRKAHEMGALVLWDLSHSTGAVSVDLGASEVDLAVGCTYKYLNGGPGAPAFLYVKDSLQDSLLNPLSGWMGHQHMFEFGLDYQPAKGIGRFLTGTPPILSTAMIEPGVDLLLEAGMEKIVAKSQQLTTYFHDLFLHSLEELGFQFESPLDPMQRGGHVSLSHPHALEIDLALIQEKQVIPDFRAPNNLRFGMAALYTSFEDIYHSVEYLIETVHSEGYRKFADHKPTIT